VLALTAGLSACANLPATTGAPTTDALSASNEINVDPLDAPPPVAAAAPVASEVSAAASDPLLLVPAQTQASQRVPLGTLNASADPKPAAKPPTPLAAPAAAAAPPAPAPTPAAPPPAPAQVAAASVAPASASPAIAKPPVHSIPSSTQAAGSLTSPRGAANRMPDVSPPPPTPTVEARAEPQAASPAKPLPSDEQETTIISSATAPPSIQSREFIPAPVVPTVAAPAPPALGEMPFSQAEKNVARRFETLSRLRDEGLITQEEFNRRRAANLGAILPYSQDPPGVGLDRAVPSGDAIVARLGALRRSFEMRAITAQQHALERTMILNALLPENPEQRTARKPPPEDVIQGAAMVGHLEALREESVITQPELDAEKRMIDAVLRTGLFPPKGGEAAQKPAQAKTAAKPVAPNAAGTEARESPMTTQITGPVLHLASFRSEASAMKGWQEVLERNKATVGSLKPIIRRVDLGEGKGIFYRLMTGSFTSMAEAEATCVKLKQNNQFCRASADGS
jgi:hypothetical protein